MRYISAYNFSGETLENGIKVGNFWVNSLSTYSVIKRMYKVSDTLYRVDLRDYGWSEKSWDKLISLDGKVRNEPYFVPGAVPEDAEYLLREKTYSVGAIVRLDYFIVNTSLEPLYSEF